MKIRLGAWFFTAMLASAGGTQSFAADDLKITMIIYTAPGVPFFNPLLQGAKDAAKATAEALTAEASCACQEAIKRMAESTAGSNLAAS